jgi:hypothetical protein
MNVVNYADGLMRELTFYTKKAEKDAVLKELAWASEEVKKFDVSALEEDGKAHFHDVVSRLAEVMDVK